jgi:hypothetical protein
VDDDGSPSFACSKHQFGRYRLLGRVVRLRKDRRFDVCIGLLDATHCCVIRRKVGVDLDVLIWGMHATNNLNVS